MSEKANDILKGGGRLVTDHHDGHRLSESIVIVADAAGPGGASHNYTVFDESGEMVASIQFQKGPSAVAGSTSGIVDSVLLGIAADRMRCFNDGEYRCRENSLVLTHIQEALHWLKHRSDERARRGVLGTTEK